MSVPTPVTKSSIVTDSGSTRKPIFTWKPPEMNQVKRLRTWLRGSTLRNARNVTTVQRNDPPIIEVPIHPAHGSPMRLPNRSSSTAPASGSSGMIHTRSSRSRAFTADRPPEQLCAPSALQQVDVVGGRALTAPEDRDDDGETDRDLRGGDDEGEEHDHLAARVVEHAGEGHERHVRRVEHELHAHEHDDDVAPHEEPDRADREEHRGEHQVVVAGDRRGDHRVVTSWGVSAGTDVGGGR